MENLYDVIVVGGGPAGLSAAIYVARAKYRVLVLEEDKIGGQITITHEVVNYPGVFSTSGTELTSSMERQAKAFGAEFASGKVKDIDSSKDIKRIITDTGEFQALGVILAVGANPRKLGFDGEEKFQGAGVAYCATCDGEFFKNMPVYVIGGGFAAVEEGVFLTKYASEVHIILRKDSFSCARTVADKALNHPKIKVHYHTEVEKVTGNSRVDSITLVNNQTKETQTITEEKGLGVFVFGGYVPNTSWLPGEISLENGYIVTNSQQETNVAGIYAAGDVCIKKLRQVVTAVSDGAVAGTSIERYVEYLHQKLDLPDFVSKAEAPAESSGSSSVASGEFAHFAEHQFITPDMMGELSPVLEKLQNSVLVKVQLAEDDLSEELEIFGEECKKISPKIQVSVEKFSGTKSYLELCKENGESSGVRFEAVPGGHEFNSFLAGIFALSGLARPLEDGVLAKIKGLKPMNLKVLVTLSCSNCPDVVIASEKIAMAHPEISCTIMDANYAPELRETHNIMSVPCLLVNDETLHFGRKQMDEILEILSQV